MSSITIKLLSSDGALIPVDVKVIQCSEKMMMWMEDLGVGEGPEDNVLPLPHVRSTTLKKILEWATHHKGEAPPVEEDLDDERTGSTHKQTDISPWDADFLNVEQSLLFDLMLASLHLGMTRLMDLTCQTIANMIKGKTAEEIRQMFNIRNDFTPEQEEQIRRENEWLEEWIQD